MSKTAIFEGGAYSKVPYNIKTEFVDCQRENCALWTKRYIMPSGEYEECCGLKTPKTVN